MTHVTSSSIHLPTCEQKCQKTQRQRLPWPANGCQHRSAPTVAMARQRLACAHREVQATSRALADARTLAGFGWDQKVLPATRTSLTQAGARASNTFWNPKLGSIHQPLPTERWPITDRLPTVSAQLRTERLPRTDRLPSERPSAPTRSRREGDRGIIYVAPLLSSLTLCSR